MKAWIPSTLITALMVIVLSGWGSLPATAEDDPKALEARIEELFQQQRFDEAIPLAERLFRLRQKTLGAEHQDTVESMGDLGVLLLETGDLVRAEPLLRLNLTLMEKVRGEQHPETANSLQNLAYLEQRLGHFRQALSYYERAMRIYEASKDVEPSHRAICLSNLASVYTELDDDSGAEQTFRRALDAWKQVEPAGGLQTSDCQNNLAVLYIKRGDLTRARALLEQALKTSQEHRAWPSVVTQLAHLASICSMEGDILKAEPLLERALALSEEATGPNSRETGGILNNLASVYMDAGKYEQAKPLFQRALDIHLNTLGPEHPDTVDILGNLADFYNASGDYEQAEALCRQALEICQGRRGESRRQILGLMSNLAGIERNRGRLSEAIKLYRQVLTLAKESLPQGSAELAIYLNSLGTVYLESGDYASAERLLNQALDIRKKLPGPEVATTLSSLAGLYSAMGDHARAAFFQEQALNIRERMLGPEHPTTAGSLSNLGTIYISMGEPTRAEPFLRRALAIQRAKLGSEHRSTAVSLNNLAEVYVATGRHELAEPLYQQALTANQNRLGPEHPNTAISLNNLAGLYGKSGDVVRAQSFYEQALAIDLKTLGPDHPNTAICLNNLALLEIRRGHSESALERVREAMRAEERALANVLSFTSEKQRLAYQATLDPYILPATIGSAPDLARVVLRFKGIVLDSLVEDLRLALASGDPSTRRLVEDLRAARSRLSHLTTGLPVDLTSNGLKRQERERERLQAQVEGMEGELARQVAGLDRPRRALAVTPDQVRAALPEGAVLVEFLRHRFFLGKESYQERYGAVILSRDTTPCWIVLGKAEDLEQQVRSCQQAVSAVRGRLRTVKRPTQEGSSAEALEPGLRALYDSLWAPLEKSLPAGTRTVILSPDGELNFVSWASLLTPEDRFLAQQYELLFVSSGRDLLKSVKAPGGPQAMALGDAAFSGVPAVMASKPAPASGSVLAASGFAQRGGLVPPEQQEFQGIQLASLPGTRAEVDGLEALLKEAGWKVEMAQGPGASEAWVRSARSPRVLHLATHGFFLPIEQMAPPDRLLRGEEPDTRGKRFVNPMQRSGLALTGAQTTFDAWKRHENPAAHSDNDGVLTADEAGTLDLSGTWLVCLSACETAQGEARAGEGVLGLRRGFVQAGARNLLMTLWSVADDETARFMADFYRAALADGKAPATLARVQRDWLVRLRQERGLDAAVYLVGPFQLNFQGQP